MARTLKQCQVLAEGESEQDRPGVQGDAGRGEVGEEAGESVRRMAGGGETGKTDMPHKMDSDTEKVVQGED